MFLQFNGAVVVNTVGHKPVAYLAPVQATGRIVALDLETPSLVDFAALRFHTFTGEGEERNSRKKIMRVKVFGEGDISLAQDAAYMVVTVDNARNYVYPYSLGAKVPGEDVLWAQGTHSIVGRTIDVTLYLMGAGIIIRECQVQYALVS